MAPGTLPTSPAAAQDPGQRRRGPQPGLSASGDTQNPRAISLHGVGRGHPSTPQIEPAGCLRGKWGGRTIQVQRHGDGGSGWSRALAGRFAICSGSRVYRGKGPAGPLCAFARTPAPTPHPQARAFVLAPARLVFWPPLPSQSLSQTQRKPQPPNRASRSRTYREAPGAVAVSLPARPHSKRKERTAPSRHSPQLRES